MYLIYRLGNLALSCSKLPKTKDAWTVRFECMHGVVGPRSLVEVSMCGVTGHRILGEKVVCMEL